MGSAGDRTSSAAVWLVSDAGLESIAEATGELDAGRTELAVAEYLRRRLDPARSAAVAEAAVARRRARDRWPQAEQLVFQRETLEQASDPAVARWRAARFAGRDVWDLCAGAGADAAALATAGATVTAVELDPARAVLLRHNLEVLGVDVDVRCTDALGVRLPPDTVFHVDPSRRDGERRLRRLTDLRPPVDELLTSHGAAPGFALTLAPGLDAVDPVLNAGAPATRAREVEFVQVDGQLTEAVVWGGELARSGIETTATLLPAAHELRRPAHSAPARLAVGEPGTFLVQVAPAAVRARVHDGLGAAIGARRIAEHRALLTTDDAPPASPWYVVRSILAVLPARAPAIRRWLAAADPSPVEVVFHGVDGDPAAWWRALGRPRRGPTGWRVELVRRDRDSIALITRS